MVWQVKIWWSALMYDLSFVISAFSLGLSLRLRCRRRQTACTTSTTTSSLLFWFTMRSVDLPVFYFGLRWGQLNSHMVINAPTCTCIPCWSRLEKFILTDWILGWNQVTLSMFLITFFSVCLQVYEHFYCHSKQRYILRLLRSSFDS